MKLKLQAYLKRGDFTTLGMQIIRFFETKNIHHELAENEYDGTIMDIYSIGKTWFLVLMGNQLYLRFGTHGIIEKKELTLIGSQLELLLRELIAKLNMGEVGVLPELYSVFEGLSEIGKLGGKK